MAITLLDTRGCLMKTYLTILLAIIMSGCFGMDREESNDAKAILNAECDFHDIAMSIPLAYENIFDITSDVKEKSHILLNMQKLLPNVQKVFISNKPYFAVLIGWSYSLIDYSRITVDQTKSVFLEVVEYGKANFEEQGGESYHKFGDKEPLTMYYTLLYNDNGFPSKDIGMDVVATPHCIFSMKISGHADVLGDEYWQGFKAQMEYVRKLIKDQYGIVQFSTKGKQ